MRNRLIMGLLLTAFFLSAQKDKRTAPFSIRGNIGIPRTLTSQMFRTGFNGVYEGNLSVNFRLFDNFSAGLGYQNTQFQNNKKLFAFYTAVDPKGNATGAFLSYNTRLQCHGAFLKLTYDKFFSKGYVSYALNSGLMFSNYMNVIPDTSVANRPYGSETFSTPYFQPEFGVHFLTDGNLSFSLLLSYSTMLYNFDPKAPRFNHIKEIHETNNRYLISWVNIGFGFNILLGRK